MKPFKFVCTIACFCLFMANGYSQRYKFNSFTKENGLPSNSINTIAQDNEGYLWIGTDQGLSRFDGNNFVNFDQVNGLDQNYIKEIIINRDNELYVVHEGNRFSKKIDNNTFSSIAYLPNKNFFNYTANKIKSKIINGNEVLIEYKNPITLSSESGLEADSITATYIDRENVLWIATKNQGLYNLPLQNFPVFSWDPTKKMKSIYKVNDSYFILTYEKTIVGARFVDGKPTYRVLYKSNRRLINSALLLDQNNLFFGTDQGLFLLYKRTNSLFSFKEMLDKNITSLEKTTRGDILIIADNKAYKYSSSRDKINPIFELENQLINGVEELNGSYYFFGEKNVFKLKNNKISSLIPNDETNKNFGFSHISSFENKNIWLSTRNKGVYYYDNDEQKLISFNEEQNFPYTSILSTIQKEKTLWITTNNGIVNFDLEKNAYQFYGKKYLGNLMFLPFAIETKQKIYSASTQGFIEHYDPDFFNSKESNLSFTKILVAGKSIGLDSTFTIDYNTFPIQFNFQSLSFKNKIFYQHWLEGVDKGWSTASLSSTISYNSLPPGAYTLRVRTFDPINNIALDEITEKFKVSPPFWKTISFFYYLVFILILIGSLFYLSRVWRLKKQTSRLEKMVDEKTYTLSAQNQNIEQFSYSLSHDLKNPINNIKGLVEIMEGAGEEEQSQIRKMLMSSAILLEDKIKDTLTTIQQMQRSKKNVELVNFDAMFEQTKRSLLILIGENNVKFTTNFKVKSMYLNASILESVFYNMISNSVKYGPTDKRTEIKITSAKKDEKVVLTFADNGIGMDLENDLDKVFSIFERIDENTDTSGTGIGLYMIKQMIELNGGSIAVESELGKGTKFFVTLTPMEK